MQVEVKGSLIIDFVKMVRGNKDIDWSQWLMPEDLETVNSEVLTSAWYPYQLYRNLGQATFKEIAGSDLELVKTFGRLSAQNLLELYRNLIITADPKGSIDKVMSFWITFFRAVDPDSGLQPSESKQGECWRGEHPLREKSYRIDDSGGHCIIFKLEVPKVENDKQMATVFAYQFGGMLMELAEQAGGSSPGIEVETQDLTNFLTVHWA